jgi:hypothetical protein
MMRADQRVTVLPAVANAAANPDAELIALGVQLDEVEQEPQALSASPERHVGPPIGRSF